MTDQSNAVVAGADVRLIDTTTGKAQATTSNETGRYVFVNVSPGTYNLEISKTGFAKARVDGQAVDVGQATSINVALKVGQATETVSVEATGAQLQTMNATVGTTIGFTNLQEMPNLGRDASSLVELQPGVSMNGSVAGAVRDQNTFQLDGGNNTNDMDGTMNTYTPSYASGPGGSGGGPTGVMPTPVESVEEFKVDVTNQTADFNGSAGAQVQMVTRRGGQSWHGALYDFYFGSNLGANSWANNHTPVKNLQTGAVTSPFTPLPSNHYNRFGGSAGGPVTSKNFLGGKTYLFANYEAYRFPQNTTFERQVPSDLLKAGVVMLQDGNGTYRPFNLNPVPVTVNGTTYQPATCGGSPCDPRGIGINSLVQQLWKQHMPEGNDPTTGDGQNTLGYLAPLKLPQKYDFGVARMDHDFGAKWHFMSSFHYYDFARSTNDQTDFGSMIGGAPVGTYVATSSRPQLPWSIVGGMTTNITPTVTNDFHYTFLRNWWQWGTQGGVGQYPQLGGALEIGGESQTASLIPYNINTQNTRSRVWDGHDQTFRDDMTMLHGNHLFQFGGTVEHNWDLHSRNDNGGGIDAFNIYQISGTSGTSGATTGLAQPTAPTGTDSLGNACGGGNCSASASTYEQLYAEVLGIVTQSQSLYSRAVPNMSLLPLGTPVAAHVITDYYGSYFNDSWHVKPSITLTYGLSYLLQMPPYEQDGKQVMLVNAADQPIYLKSYLQQRQASALNPSCTGTVDTPSYSCSIYNPIVGFASVGNVGAGRKYPYDTFYGGFSPHVAVAWNPKFTDGILGKLTGNGNTVLRAGYSQIYGRLNGVANILTPLLTPSLLQAVQCVGVVNAANAQAGNQCLGTGGATAATAFRIGTDGTAAPLPPAVQTLPQPYFPGVNGQASVGDALGLDPSFRPNMVKSIDVTIQRQISSRMFLEIGYIGRYITNELIDLDINAVPYMTTLGGESFADAFGKLYTSVCALTVPTCATTKAPTKTGATAYSGPALPFFEAAMGGPTSAYCTGYSSCTAAVASKTYSNYSQAQAFSMWSSLSASGSWVLGRTLPQSNPPGGCLSTSPVCQQSFAIGQSLSDGYSNYNAGFATFTMRDWHGMTGTSNFTYGHALGLGATTQSTSLYTVQDPWNLRAMYGEQFFDSKYIFNQLVTYHTPFYKGQQGMVGRLLGGWGLSPIFVAQSGLPLEVNQGSDCQAFGESNCDDSTNENAVLLGSRSAVAYSTHYGVVASGAAGKNGNINPACIVNGAVTCGGVGLNVFSNPQAAYNSFRPLILGVDTAGGGGGRIRGLPIWNVDMQITKNTKFTERFNGMFYATFTNIFNHFQPSDPGLNIQGTGIGNWGKVTGQVFAQRQLELGLRIGW